MVENSVTSMFDSEVSASSVAVNIAFQSNDIIFASYLIVHFPLGDFENYPSPKNALTLSQIPVYN